MRAGKDLPIANRVFLVVGAAGVGMQAVASRLVHTHIVAGLMHGRVDRRVVAHVDRVADQAGFLVAPEAAGDTLAGIYTRKGQTQAREKRAKSVETQRFDSEHALRYGHGVGALAYSMQIAQCTGET